MKIKYDFVTNSSSVAYVVMVPNNFYLNENEIREEYKENELYEKNPPTVEDVIKELSECIEILKEGDNIWHYGQDGVNQTVFYMLGNLCQNHDFSIASIDISSEGNNIIQGVKEEVIENVITSNIDIMSIFKLIQRGNENDSSKAE